MTSTVSYLLTARGVTLNIAGRPYAVDKTSSVYAKVIEAIKQKADGAAVLKLLTVAAAVAKTQVGASLPVSPAARQAARRARCVVAP